MEVSRGSLLDSLQGSDNFDKSVCLAKYLSSEIGWSFLIDHMMSDTYVLTFRSYDIEDAVTVVFRGTRCTVFLSGAALRTFVGPFSGDGLTVLLDLFGIE